MQEGLPEGFFDDEQRGEKVQSRLTGKVKEKEKEKEEQWKKYQQEIAIETTEQEKKQLTAEIEDQVTRELTDAQFQIHLYNKSDKLADKFEKTADMLRNSRKEKSEKMQKDIESLIKGELESDDSDIDLDEEGDWRNRE